MTITEQENEIIKLAFFEELEKLEKLAGWKATAAKYLSKFFSGASRVSSGNYEKYFSEAKKVFSPATGKAFKKGVGFLKGFAKEPNFIKTKGVITQAARQTSVGEKSVDNMIARSIGKTVNSFSGFGEGVKDAKGFFGKGSRIVKNIAKNTAQDFRNANYRTWEPDKFVSVARNSNKKATHLITRYGKNRKILGTAADGSFITKKRILPRVGGWAFAPAGMAATTVLSAKEDNKNKAKEGVMDFLKWKTPVGMAEMNFDMAKWGLGKLTN